MEVQLGHSLEDMTDVFSVGLGVGEGYEKVIYIDDKPSFSNHVAERVIHESLESSGGVVETKEHDCQFKESFVSDKGCLPLVAIFDVDVVVSPSNIKLGEMASILQFVYEVRDERRGVSITGGMLIEISVVLAEAEFTVFLLDKEERGCLRGARWTDLSCSWILFEKVLGSFLFIGGKWVDFAYFRYEGFVEIDLVVVGLGRGDVVSCFFREDLGEVSIFRWE